MACRSTWLWKILGALLAAALPSCSLRTGLVRSGPLPPPDGEQRTQSFFRSLTDERKAAFLPPVARDPTLDASAAKGLRAIEAGVADGVSAVNHVGTVAPLPDGLSYGVGFEPRTPGVDERLREIAAREGSATVSDQLLAADPALDGVGWASGGPWSVVVFRARRLGPADAAALRSALQGELARTRPELHPDPKVEAVAGEAVADGLFDLDDVLRYGQAGGVPVPVTQSLRGPHLPTSWLNQTLDDEGPGTLGDPWLTQVGVATRVGDDGKVTWLVLATGASDVAALNAQLDAAAAQATDAVNTARAESAVPPVRPDQALMEAAKAWTVEASTRGCFVGANSSTRSCPGGSPHGASLWWMDVQTWWSPEEPFRWYLAPAEPGDELLKRFGTAATMGADGLIWSVLVLAT